RNPRLRKTVTVALSLLVLSIPLWGFSETYRQANMSEDYRGRKIVEAVADNTAPNAIVIQHRSPLQYMKLVEGRREDVLLWGFNQPNDQGQVAEALKAIRDGRLYVVPSEGKVSQPEAAGYGLVPVEEGVLYRVISKQGT
ncbi:MAG: hypothetical protein CYG60_02415, partial [Actinobacteria bacterium]